MRRFLLLITTFLLSNALVAQTISINPNAITGCPSVNEISLGTITINEGGNGNFRTPTSGGGATQEIRLELPTGFTFGTGVGVVTITNASPDITLPSNPITIGTNTVTIRINNQNPGSPATDITANTTDIITITGLTIIAPAPITNGQIEANNPVGPSFSSLNNDKFGDIDISTPTVTIASPVCGNTVNVKASPANGTRYIFERKRGGGAFVKVQDSASDTWVATLSGDENSILLTDIVEDDEIRVTATVGGCTGIGTKTFDDNALFLVTFDAGTGTVLKNPKDPFDISTGDSPAKLGVTGGGYVEETPPAFNCINCEGITPDPCNDPCPNPACPDCPPPPDCSDPCANPFDCICNNPCRDLPPEQRPICRLEVAIAHALIHTRDQLANVKRIISLANRKNLKSNNLRVGPANVRYEAGSWVFDPAGLAPGEYTVEYSGKTNDPNAPCNTNEGRKIIFKVTVFEDKQLLGIVNSGVCKETADNVRIGWLGQTPGLRELISISDENVSSGLITGTLTPNYRRGINSGFVINKSALATTNATSFRAKIDYRQSNGSGGFVNLTAFETVTIVPSPTIEIRVLGGDSLLSSYCVDASSIDLSGYVKSSSGPFIQADVANSSFYIYNNDIIPTPANKIGSRINAKLYFELGGDLPPTVPPNNPNVLRLNTSGYTLSYIYVNDFGCRDTIQRVISVNPLPGVVATDTLRFNFCIGKNVTNLVVPGFDTLNTGRQLIWYNSTGIAIDTVTNAIGFVSKVRNEFANSEEFQVAELSSSGCIGQRILAVVNIGTPPKADFSIGSACLGSKIRFTDTSTPNPNTTGIPPLDKIALYEWDFGNGTASGDTLRHPESPSYMIAGVYNIKLKITTGSGCIDSISKKIIVHKNAALINGIYSEDFESTDTTQITWTSSGWTEPNGVSTKSSWKITPVRRADGTLAKVFATSNTSNVSNLDVSYNNSEYSWIESPCFDLSVLSSPLINIKMRYDTDVKADGVFVMYTVDNGANWEILGDFNQGADWYNVGDILGLSVVVPTTINPGRKGWSGKSNDFIDAKLSLASIKQKISLSPNTPVRFRIVFASNADNPAGVKFSGVAIDRVVILDKNHKVLLEHFTNTTSSSYQDLTWTSFTNSASATDVVRVQYHTTFPIGDAIGQASRPESNARSLYYAVPQPPYTVVDGKMEAGKMLYKEWNPTANPDAYNYYLQRNLVAATFTIGAPVFTGGTNGNPLGVSVGISRTNTPSDKANPIIAHLMIVEHNVNGNINVVRKMLPSPEGTRLGNMWAVGSNYSLQGSWKPRNAIAGNTHSVVVFVSDEQTKEVYQADIFPITQNVDAKINERRILEGSDVVLYPNPTSSDVTVVLPDASAGKISWRIFDSLGREVEGGSGSTENATFKAIIQHCTSGIYVIEISTSEWKVRKSISVIK